MGRQIHFGVFMLGTGNHYAGWRHPGAFDTFVTLDVARSIAETAERGKFDLLFLGDGFVASPDTHPSWQTRPEPIIQLAAIAAMTTHVGLGATASTTYSEPFTVARAFASLDHLSGGRAAWNIVTTGREASGAHFGRAHPDHDRRYEIADEFYEVVRGLWDCWDDDAVVADRETGEFVDWSKVRTLDHEGTYFKCKGPLNISRSPQGHPVILQAGGSDIGQKFAAKTADIVFTVVGDYEDARERYLTMRRHLEEANRNPDDVCIMPGVMPIVGRTDGDALDKLNTLQGYMKDGRGLEMLSDRLGHDLRSYSMDDPVPDLPLADASHGFARALLGRAKRENLKLRDLYNLTMAARGHYVLCGSPQTIADEFERWFAGDAADGFNVMPTHFPQAFDAFVDEVVPELQKRGLYRNDYAGPTLRDHLGIARPAVPAR
jgi:FMN-dependent oxidoreductase (nitrilotriacetate monooxygenase family)